MRRLRLDAQRDWLSERQAARNAGPKAQKKPPREPRVWLKGRELQQVREAPRTGCAIVAKIRLTQPHKAGKKHGMMAAINSQAAPVRPNPAGPSDNMRAIVASLYCDACLPTRRCIETRPAAKSVECVRAWQPIWRSRSGRFDFLPCWA